MEHTPSAKAPRLFAPDAVRVTATLFILLFHFNYLTASLSAAPAVGFLTYANGSMGHIGVSLFFILSGYTLFLRWNGRMQLRPYFLSRIRSVLPMYWIGYLVLFLYTDILHGAFPHDIPKSRLVLTFLGMDGYLAAVLPTFYKIGEWFVGCILLLYAVFPLLLKALNAHPRILFCAACALFAAWVLLDVSPVPIEHSFLTRIPEFLAGMYFARYRSRFDLRRYGFFFALPLCAVLLVPLPFGQPLCTLLTGVCCFPVLFALAECITAPRVRRAVSICARYSYAVFLVHHVTLDILFRPFLTGKSLDHAAVLGVFAVYLAAVCCAGVLLSAAHTLICRGLHAALSRLRAGQNT